MDGILDSIAELVASADLLCPTALRGVRAMRMLAPCAPALTLLADDLGDLISVDTYQAEGDTEAAAALASALAALLKEESTCAVEHCVGGAGHQAVAVKLSERARSLIVGAVLQHRPPRETVADPSARAWLVAGALAWGCACKSEESYRRQTRLEQLEAEIDALRSSHAEAVTTAIQEREERLRQHEEHVSQLQAVMMMAADGIVTVDETGTIQSFNEAAGWIFGYAPNEVIGQNISLLFPAPDRAQDGSSGQRAAEGPAVFGSGGEVVGLRKNGSTFPLDLALSEVCLGNRKIFTGIFRDITERKRAEEALRQLHIQNESILNSVGEGIVGLDDAGNLMFVNPTAARMLGWEVEELVGKPFHATVHHTKLDGKPCPPAECPVLNATAPAAAPVAGSDVFWKKDGTSIPVEYMRTSMREGSGIGGVVVTFRDITEQRRLEAQLRQAQKLESIGQLAAGIAHEINTPTQYIGDNTRFLQDSFEELRGLLTLSLRLRDAARAGEPPPDLEAIAEAVEQADVDYLLEEIPRAIAQSLEGVERVAKIVRSMKEFSHPSGESFQAVDLNHAIETTLTVSRNEWKYVAEAVTELDPMLPLVTCLAGDINQVVLNLIVNAAQAIGERVGDGAGEKGRIVVRTRLDGDWVEIQVDDNGTGIPEAIQARIFDPFFTTKPVGQGTGQGLAICHSIVKDKHHGSLTFETEVGRGTTFTVRLPIHQKISPPGDGCDEKAPLVRG